MWYFIALTLWGFQLIRRSEKNLIYAGMARETAHQLGTPVSSLMGWVKLLKESKGDSRDLMNSMEEDIGRLSEISDRFSKIGSNPQLKPVDLYELVIDVTNYMKYRLPQQSRILLSNDGENNIQIMGDRILLRWAIENLLKNAVDAIGKGAGKIVLSLSSINDEIILDVQDSGKGIPRSEWKNIFRPGYSSKRRGWGLGLSLTQRIVEEIHKGSIKVLQSKPNETVFRLRFII